jgi:hypothetical protein
MDHAARYSRLQTPKRLRNAACGRPHSPNHAPSCAWPGEAPRGLFRYGVTLDRQICREATHGSPGLHAKSSRTLQSSRRAPRPQLRMAAQENPTAPRRPRPRAPYPAWPAGGSGASTVPHPRHPRAAAAPARPPPRPPPDMWHEPRCSVWVPTCTALPGPALLSTSSACRPRVRSPPCSAAAPRQLRNGTRSRRKSPATPRPPPQTARAGAEAQRPPLRPRPAPRGRRRSGWWPPRRPAGATPPPPPPRALRTP